MGTAKSGLALYEARLNSNSSAASGCMKCSSLKWIYLQAPNQEALCYKDCYEEQEQKYCCKVIVPMRDSLQVFEPITDLECVQGPNQEALCYKDRYEEWEQKYCCKVITSTRDTFQDMFDDDNTLAYEPESTAAVILCGSDEEAEAAALEVSKISLKGNHSHCWGEVP